MRTVGRWPIRRPRPDLPAPGWDGFADIAYGSQEDIGAVLGQEQYAKRIIADERTAFRMVTREVAREYIVIPSTRHRDPVSLVKIHRAGQDSRARRFRRAGSRRRPTSWPARRRRTEYVRRYAQRHRSARRRRIGGLDDRRHPGPVLGLAQRRRGLPRQRRSRCHRGGGKRVRRSSYVGIPDRGELRCHQSSLARTRDRSLMHAVIHGRHLGSSVRPTCSSGVQFACGAFGIRRPVVATPAGL